MDCQINKLVPYCYNPDDAGFAVRYSSIVYSDQANRYASCISRTRIGTGAVAFFIEKDVLFISFMGTNFNHDIKKIATSLVDADLKGSFYLGGGVHHGFLKEFDSMYAIVVDKLITIKNEFEIDRIVITGHSKGGSVAIICACLLKNMGYDPTVYAFGAPKTGDKRFADYVSDSQIDVVSITLDKDFIPRLPLLFKYKEVGHNIRLSHEGTILKKLPWYLNLINFFNWIEFTDHYRSEYIEAITKLNKGLRTW